MHIQLSRKQFGDHILYTLGTTDTHIQFVPERSGYVHQIRLQGRDLLWNYDSGEALTENNAYRNLALLPFPNRLLEGQYEWNGDTYVFEVNHPESRSALHGFGPMVPFSIERIDFSEHKAEVKLSYLHRRTQHSFSYPFLVRFDLALAIDIEAHTASWQLSTTNLDDEAAPVGLGWHPYFLMPGGSENWKIQLPPNEFVELELAIPTGKRSEGLSTNQPSLINTAWDDCFALTDPQFLEVQLLGPEFSLSLKQTGSTRYTQLYVPPGAKCIAIEPMTCGVNAFNTGKEEVELAPKQKLNTGMEIALI